jgi:mannose-1-phosphate guanylyltransferase/mannose-6-phosphate isomerase
VKLFEVGNHNMEDTLSELVIPAIMVGGSGTRLWPISRSNKPKQFLSLDGKSSMFQNTVTRVIANGFSRPWLLANEDATLHINSQLPSTGTIPEGVIIEPVQRGTAAAVAAIAQVIGSKKPDAIILVMPADHVISEPSLFREAVLRSVPLAKQGMIVTFGIIPTAPETGYGYIKPGHQLHVDNQALGFSVEQPGGFLEKPNAHTASTFVEQGYLWNAGIFLFMASTMIKEFQTYARDTLSAVSIAVSFRAEVKRQGTTYHYLLQKSFEKVPKDMAIDTAIMEKSAHVALVPCGDIGWHDVGSLSAIWDMAEKCDQNNVVIGTGHAHKSTGLLIYSDSGRKIVGSHIDDLMIVDTKDALIVIPRNKAQEIKQIVDAMKASDGAEVADTMKVTFPWGEVQQVSKDSKIVVSMVTLNGLESFDRACMCSERETWTVTNGEIEFVRAGHTLNMGEGKSISVDFGTQLTIRVLKGPAACVVICKLSEGQSSLEKMFAADDTVNDFALRVA